MPSLVEESLRYAATPEETLLAAQTDANRNKYEAWIRDRILRFSREIASMIQQHGFRCYVNLKPWAYVIEARPGYSIHVHFQDGDRVFFDRHLGSLSTCVGRDVHGDYAPLVAVMMALRLREKP